MNNKSLKEIMSMTVENLAKKQHDALKQHALDVLDRAKKYIEEERYDDIQKDLTFYSDCGDGWGSESTENYPLEFGIEVDDRIDIAEISSELLKLKKKMEK